MTDGPQPGRLVGPGFSGLLPRDSASPDIFDAVAHPGIVLPLVLANLISPLLWELCEQVRAEASATRGESDPDFAPPLLRVAQRELDRHFEHLAPARVSELDGELDLPSESERLGSDVVEYAVERILRTARWRLSRGTLNSAGAGGLADLVAAGRFPAYFYATIDEAHAHRRLLGRRKHKPAGLTSCLDEAAIFTAMSILLQDSTADGWAILGGPSHYSVLGWGGGAQWWFFGKDALLSRAEWARIVAEDYGGDAQLAFDDRLPDLDCIITADGILDLAGSRTTLSPTAATAAVAEIDGFFGQRLAQLAAGRSAAVRRHPAADFHELLREASALPSHGSVRELILRSPAPAAQAAAMAHRSLTVADPGGYLVAARNSPRCRELSATVGSVADAIAAVAAVPGDVSIFEDRDRIAMPDETLRLGTGTDRDKALALHVLLEHLYDRNGWGRPQITTTLGHEDSVVSGDGFSVSTRSFADTEAPPAGIVLRS